jgi:GTPase
MPPQEGKKAGFVAIVGRPNAGKSSLLNALLGVKVSIVTPKAQTTRERVLGIMTEAKGQIVFVDTPGIHKAREGGINEFMVNEAREALDAPSAVWYLVDPTSGVKHEGAVLDLIQDAPSAPLMVLFTKFDLKGRIYSMGQLEAFEKELSEELERRGMKPALTLRVSSEKGRGLDELLAATWGFLPEHPLFYPDEEQLSDRPARFFVAEKVREQLFRCLGDELPYSCAVETVIHVERDSQKGMVIGKGGAKIKEIGSNARREVEEFLGHGVFLGLKVNVLKDWTRDAQAMKRMGYLLPEKRSRQRPAKERP